jgi:hypothetical protein
MLSSRAARTTRRLSAVTDGSGDYTEYKVTSDPPSTLETISFSQTTGKCLITGATIKHKP